IARPEGLAVDLMNTNSAETVSAGGRGVQVGAADSEDGANQMIADATQSYGQLTDLRSYVEPFERNGVTYYRARFAGFADRTQARTTCDALAADSINCLTVQG